jgi:uncharacterized protein with PIN domain
MTYITGQQHTARLDAMVEEFRRIDARQAPPTHRCGRCGAQAQQVESSIPGAHCYVCFVCSEKGWATFCQFGPFAPTEAR